MPRTLIRHNRCIPFPSVLSLTTSWGVHTCTTHLTLPYWLYTRTTRYINYSLVHDHKLRELLDFYRLWASCVLYRWQRHLACSLSGHSDLVRLCLVSLFLFDSVCSLSSSSSKCRPVSTFPTLMWLALPPAWWECLQFQLLLHPQALKSRLRLAVLPPNHLKVFKPQLRLAVFPPNFPWNSINLTSGFLSIHFQWPTVHCIASKKWPLLAHDLHPWSG